MLLIQANLLNRSYQRLCYTFKSRVMESEDVMRKHFESLGIVVPMDRIHPFQVAHQR
jgi:hypothetical protein